MWYERIYEKKYINNTKTKTRELLMNSNYKKTHPFPPIYDKKSKILLLGSFPSIILRKNNFYFSHFKNQFWQILSIIFNEEIIDKKKFLLNHNIALWDVVKTCEITNSSDLSIKNVKENDIKKILKVINIKAIFTIGNKATKLFKKYIESDIDMSPTLLPSTSPAYQKMKIEEKIQKFKIIKNYLK